MQNKSGFTTNNSPKVSVVMQHFIVALVKDVIICSKDFESSKKHLKAYCDNEKLSYSLLEYNLNLFFELLEDYRKTNNFVLYRFLKLQARFCFIDEDMFGLLQIALPEMDSFDENQDSGAYANKTTGFKLAVHNAGIVGGHLIGLL
ncbi:MAG: hypothetical protein LLF95_05110 [Bacteroidales bacterium]|nr:hypothetical protein [Bacteroidales bacterium]